MLVISEESSALKIKQRSLFSLSFHPLRPLLHFTASKLCVCVCVCVYVCTCVRASLKKQKAAAGYEGF